MAGHDLSIGTPKPAAPYSRFRRILGIAGLATLAAAFGSAALEPPQKATWPWPSEEFAEPSEYPYLSWYSGDATSYRVYFGTSDPPPYVGTTIYPEYGPLFLTHGTTYYWRVDAVNDAGVTTGDLWQFVAAELAEVHFFSLFEFGSGWEETSGQITDSFGRTFSFQVLGEQDIVHEWLGQLHDGYSWWNHFWFTLPHGITTVTWDPEPGFAPPDPPSQTWVVEDTTAGRELSVAFLRFIGSVSVQVTPDAGSWIFFGPNDEPPYYDEYTGWGFPDPGLEGTGDQLIPDVPAAYCYIFWKDLANYDPPEPRFQQVEMAGEQTAEIVGVYTRHTGSVRVEATPGTAPWSFTDGDGGIHAGTGDALVNGVPTGDVSLQWGALAGYDPPEPGSVTQALAKGEEIVFIGEYTPRVVPSELVFTGFLPPIGGADASGGSFAQPLRTFRRGSTMPVKFHLEDANGPLLTGVHTLQAIRYRGAMEPEAPVDAVSTDRATTGNRFRLAGEQWRFNVSTRFCMGPGTWQLVATLSDGSRHSVWVAIR